MTIVTLVLRESRRRAEAQGAHPQVIQERLGHASVAITMDRYGHRLPALDEAAVTDLETTYRAMNLPTGERIPLVAS